MAKLILDTSTWFDLAKPRVEEVLVELERQVHEQITVLLTCDIIIAEWDRNRERVLKEVMSSIASHAKSAMKMGDLLNGNDQAILNSVIQKYANVQDEQYKLADVLFARIDMLLKSSEVYTIQDWMKIDMANRAVAKQAPFHNSKNNMADALLYFGAIEYVNKNNEIATDLIFVTSNIKEFSDPADGSKLHPDLHKNNVHFHNNLAKALKMRTEVINLLDEYNEWHFWTWVESEAEIARGK